MSTSKNLRYFIIQHVYNSSYVCVCAKSSSTLCGLMNCSLLAPQSMEFSRQEYWSRLPFPTPGDLPNLGIEPASLASPTLAGGFFTTSTAGKPILIAVVNKKNYKFATQVCYKWRVFLHIAFYQDLTDTGPSSMGFLIFYPGLVSEEFQWKECFILSYAYQTQLESTASPLLAKPDFRPVRASAPRGEEDDLTWSRRGACGLDYRQFHILLQRAKESTVSSEVMYGKKNVFFFCCWLNHANKKRELVGPLLSLYIRMLSFQFLTKGSQTFPS